MRRIVVPLATAALLAVVATGVVLALNYEGEAFCQDSPAWPNGTYLGQMHPYHSDFYRGYAERRGWDPCTTWADGPTQLGDPWAARAGLYGGAAW